jgi:tetratricopeptide (TPR) repeat protein
MTRRLFRFLRRTSDSEAEREAKAVYNMATAFGAWARHEKALIWYERALEVDPGHAGAHYGRGAAFAALGRHEEAASCFERALALRPEFLNAHYGRAASLTALNRHAEAIACYDQVLARQPDHVSALYGRGLCLLASGDLPRGFAGLEHRDRLTHWKKYILSLVSPAWWGDASLAGKTILLYPDGGLGDAIQFVRYVPLLAERGARIVLRVPDKLRSLMSGMPFVDQVIVDGEPLPPHDFHCPMIRLPLVLGTTLDTIPASRYLRADAARVAAWARRLGPRRRPRVGISWAGSKLNRGYNERRSIPLEALRPLADLDCELISLQLPVPKHDRAALRAMPRLNRLGESLTDFAEIAAVIENLDLVIAVDSAIAHLAGSLGKPVWLLLCYAAEWRWLTGRTDSPWYPTARLFRQTAPGDWDGVVADVKRAWPRWLEEQTSGAATAEEGAVSMFGEDRLLTRAAR